MFLLFTGGGTIGPVTPLLAVHEAFQKIDPSVETIWIGTSHGPERILIEKEGIRFFSIPAARLSRFFSRQWILFPFLFCAALYKAIQIIRSHKPDVVGSAGGYTAVPVILAAKLFAIPVWVHQQDVQIVLTNRVTAPLADLVTVAWPQNIIALGKRARLVGNPVRESILLGNIERSRERFHLKIEKPTVLVLGGGTGSAWLNEMTLQILPKLLEHAQVIHLAGKGKQKETMKHADYHPYEFLTTEMSDALAVADVVVCRAGMGTMSELAALGKAAIIIPLPDSPQEKNAAEIANACMVLHQMQTSSGDLLQATVNLLHDTDRRLALGRALHEKLPTAVADDLAYMLKDLQKKHTS